MKRKLIVIIFIIFISINIPLVSYGRTYINEEGVTDSTDIEEEDDEEENDSEDGETEPTEPTTEVIGPGEGIEPGEGDSTGEGVSYTDDFEKINGRKYWVGWRKYHYNFTATPTARKGEPVEYTYRIINTSTHTEEIKTGTAIAKGYGLYSMDYNKHILGLLYYMSRKIAGNNYLSSYVPDDVLEFNADGTPIEQEYRLMDVACKEIADRIIETFYSSDYEQGKFKEFWEGSFTNDKANILGKLQSEFYCNAYAVNAIRKLEQMDFPFDEVTSKERAALYGMIFSIMEARYRNKNLNGKTNLQLKVSEGDL